MTATRDLEQLAWEHSIFPLVQIEELRKRGPMIWTEGEGAGLADIAITVARCSSAAAS